jgi:hypothetical protein
MVKEDGMIDQRRSLPDLWAVGEQSGRTQNSTVIRALKQMLGGEWRFDNFV